MPLCPIDRKLTELTLHQTASTVFVENGVGLQGNLVVGGLLCIGSVPQKPGHLEDFSESCPR